MPQILRVGPYSIYFWSNEGKPIEPIHVHIAEGRATSTATKLWITSTGKALLCNNNSKIPGNVLKKLMADYFSFVGHFRWWKSFRF